MQTLFDEKEQMQTENQDLTKRKAKLELTIKDVQEDMEGDAKAKVSIVDEVISFSCSLQSLKRAKFEGKN